MQNLIEEVPSWTITYVPLEILAILHYAAVAKAFNEVISLMGPFFFIVIIV